MLNRKNSKSALQKLIATALGSLALAACETPEGLVAGNSAVTIQASMSSGSNAPTPGENSTAACEPFGPSQYAGSKNGLFSKLFYLDDSQPRYSRLDDYLNLGHRADLDIYFNQLNVPTRPFDQGFASQNGTLVTTPKGDTVYEYFGLHFESELRLTNLNREGKYQFALLSDDGARMYINDSAGERKLIDSDGNHPTKLACAHEAVNMTAQTRLPIKVDYYQGPKYHIALMLLWREIPANLNDSQVAQFMNDPACNQEGNNKFFDSTKVPSAPQSTWLTMVNEGKWKVVNPQNYFLPGDVDPNPCAGSCFTDQFSNPSWNTFTLSHNQIDPSTLVVKVNGQVVHHTYDPILNVVYLAAIDSAQDVKIGYCLKQNPPSPTPVASPSPTPAPSPVASPSPSPTPCTGFSCGGGGPGGIGV